MLLSENTGKYKDKEEIMLASPQFHFWFTVLQLIAPADEITEKG